MRIVTLATDFGTSDGFAAAMIGVMKSITPDFELVEVSHGLKGIVKTSLVIERYFMCYPHGTIHVVVVDPTVGSERKALIGFNGDYFFVGPDNGIFSRAASLSGRFNWWEIDVSRMPSRHISSTFHGRDIFAPAAAMLAGGCLPGELGERVDSIATIDLPRPVVQSKSIEGEIIDIDNFGNLITNIKADMFTAGMVVRLWNNANMPILSAFSDVPRGQPLGYAGSAGYLEIGINMERADVRFQATIGGKVLVIL
jgi:S-adenosylmethionine hydrolase